MDLIWKSMKLLLTFSMQLRGAISVGILFYIYPLKAEQAAWDHTAQEVGELTSPNKVSVLE